MPDVILSREEIIAEFDQWVTPSLGDIRQTDKFRDELASLVGVMAALSWHTARNGSGHAESVRAEIESCLAEPDAAIAEERLAALVTAIYLATAKSDNAVKCQYPISFRKRHGERFPMARAGGVKYGAVPFTIKSVDIVKMAVRLQQRDRAVAAALIAEYMDFLLAHETDVSQLAALVDAFGHAEEVADGGGALLLAPLVAFQVRGSVAASGGHDPEAFVRQSLLVWGLEPGMHFNVSDVTAIALSDWLVVNGDQGTRVLQPVTDDKTRGFDFVIPCFKPGATDRIFVQSQFYAGDSGSVSHKNVDQASAARAYAARLFPDARFVELVDGAGYCSSLRKDLTHLLFAADTDDFFQLRSIPVRLRRIMQKSKIVTPLDVTLRVYEGCVNKVNLTKEIADHSAPGTDVQSVLIGLVADEWLEYRGATFEVHEKRRMIVAQYSLLDQIILQSAAIPAMIPGVEYLLTPGFGPNYGSLLEDARKLGDVTTLVDAGILMIERSN
ncbi:hypothetical protein [Cryobacterium sp. TMT2-18-3]|uniref:hypothetical protein n=1 Tax=Cryobacterium sp. TMT2-18-3 TaxID=1259250 RepID=UPI00106A311E|nr:hypothetical protein [Cryobacterium sp. TMT2-18-3]TFC26536.1 hypothetical protein E3O22_13060 [Cryobacterium sp. TMT2-18-2]